MQVLPFIRFSKLDDLLRRMEKLLKQYASEVSKDDVSFWNKNVFLKMLDASTATLSLQDLPFSFPHKFSTRL